MKTIRFGIIGGGLMGKEWVGALMRWPTLIDFPARAEVASVCSRSESSIAWFKNAVPNARQFTTDYQQMLKNPDVDAVYVAVPHHLHREIYVAAIQAGKHLLGEKPFGIDKPANDAILDAARRHPDVLVRCTSEFPFFPAVQTIARMIDAGQLGRIIALNSGFLHSSDLDPDKPINWKRQVEFNGQYGCMGDLGMHVLHVPLRAGWRPTDVRSVLSKIIDQRPDGKGNMAPCTTWDNATLLCAATDSSGATFPWSIRTDRIAPGERNTWYIEIYGTAASVRWSTRNPKILERLVYRGAQQTWEQVQTGFDPPYRTINGANFEFGFTDAMLQMVAAFVHELATGKLPHRFAGCVTPEETAISHRLFTAALESHERRSVVSL